MTKTQRAAMQQALDRKKVPLHSNPAEWRRLFTEARHTPEAQTDTDEE